MKKIKIKKNNKLLWIIIGIILVIILILFIFSRHFSKLEKTILEKDSTTIMLYMDDIENNDSKELDSYILYALDYGYNEKGYEELKAKEIKKIIEDNFNKEVTEKSINEIGITPLLMDKNVVHNPEEKSYRIDRNNVTQREIAEIPIIGYKVKSMKKKVSKYIVKYQKYIIDNPYDVLNYYGDRGKDTSKIMNYLTCKGKIKDVKLAVNDKIIKEYGKFEKKIVKVIYKLKGTRFIVDKIK